VASRAGTAIAVNALVAELVTTTGVRPGIAHKAASAAVRTPRKAAQRRTWLARQVDTLEAMDAYEDELKALTEALRHQVRCRECGRPLEDPVSVARGYGGDCWAKLNAAAS
jgi:hypothetical protein